jgi:hypothetical protein
MSALATSFKTCDDTILLLAEFKLAYLNNLLARVDAVVKTQLADIADVTAAVPTLQAAVQDLSTAAEGVIAEMPKAAVIDTAVHRMDGWALGLQQLVEIMEQGYARAPKGTRALDAGKAQIEASAKSLGVRLEVMSKTVFGLTTCVQELQGALDTYSLTLTSISSHSEKISTKSLPSIQHVAVILGKIDSIFDPLSSLLEAAHCVDAGAAQKKRAQWARDLMVKEAEKQAAPPSTFTALIESFAANELPLGQIESAVKAATKAITTESVKTFRTRAGSLKSSLDDLTQVLTHTQTYKFTDPKTQKVYDTPNDLVDQDFVDHALKYIKA